MQPYFDSTRKTTSKKNENNLKKMKNGRRAQNNEMEDDLIFNTAYLTTKTSKPNGFDTIEIDLV